MAATVVPWRQLHLFGRLAAATLLACAFVFAPPPGRAQEATLEDQPAPTSVEEIPSSFERAFEELIRDKTPSMG